MLASDLLAAASCYSKQHELIWKMWAQVGGMGREPEKQMKLADPTVRKKIVGLIHEAKAAEEEATSHLKRALDAMETS